MNNRLNTFRPSARLTVLPLWTLACMVAGLQCLLPVVATAADWPQWRYDAARSAVTPEHLPDSLHLQWTRQLPPPRPAWPPSQPSLRFDESYAPVAAGKRLYVPSMVTDSVTAYDTDGGEICWRFFSDGPVRFAPLVHNGCVYFGSDDGHLYCVDAEQGNLVWRFRGGPGDSRVLGNERLISNWPVRGAPVLHEGKIYFSASIWGFMGIFVHAVDADTGRAAWTNSGEGAEYQNQPHGGAVSFSGFVPRSYFGVRDGRLVAPGGRTPPAYYDLVSGELLEFQWDSKGNRAWQVYGDPLALTAGDKAVRAQAETVSVGDWSTSLEGDPWSLLVADGKLFVVTRQGTIYCYGAENVEIRQHDETVRSDLRAVTTTGASTEATKATPDRGLVAQAAELLESSRGYGVLLGLDRAVLPALLDGSQLQWTVVDPDPGRIEGLRREMVDAGHYGRRIAGFVGPLADPSLPPYLASVLLCAGPLPAEDAAVEDLVANSFRVLRPYGGTALLPLGREQLQECVAQLSLPNAKVVPAADGWSKLVRSGALPGAGQWTHENGDAANSVVSQDDLVRAPLSMLWFGNGPPNDEVLPRHGHGPAPQVAGGRLFIEGHNMLRAVDVYTGRLLWQRQLSDFGEFFDETGHQPGAGETGSNYVSLADSVYALDGPRILRLNAETGETITEFAVPDDSETAQNWGYLAAWKDLLVATAAPVATGADGYSPRRHASASRQLLVLDRKSGHVLWTRSAKYSFRHNNIAVGSDKLFCIDGLSEDKQASLRRRGESTFEYTPRLLALDVRTGQEIWSTDQDVFGTFLNYSVEHDVLLQAGSAARDRAKDETSKGMVAYSGSDGKALWKELERVHTGPCMLLGDRIIAQGPAYSLLTGDPAVRLHPLTDEPVPWRYTRTYGCNTATGARHLLTFRSGAAGFCDLPGGGGTGNLGGFKSSCTSNLIVADGVLSAPEYTRTCVCNYQNQTSLALVHDPRQNAWTFNDLKWSDKPIRRVGLNFGAPGDRTDSHGTLWLDLPSVGGPSPDLPVEMLPDKVDLFRQHSGLISETAAGGGPTWVAASGVVGLRQVKIPLSRTGGPPRRYTVRLHFCEMQNRQPGERPMRVAVQDEQKSVVIDVAGEAGQKTPLVREFRGVEIADLLTVSLTPMREGPEAETSLSGIEIVQE